VAYPPFGAILREPRFQAFCFRSAIVLYALILVLGSLPGARHEIGTFASGAVLHALAYSGLTALLFIGQRTESITRRAINAVLIAAAMGAGDEFVQSFLPYRGAAVLDWLVDVGASLTTTAAMCITYPRMTRIASGSRA
jgi:VanZ family protein